MNESVGNIYLNLKVNTSDLENLQSLVEHKTGALDRSARGLAGGFTVMKGAVSNLVSGAISGLVSQTKAAVTSAISYNNQLQRYTTSFKTMTGSAKDAASIMGQLSKLAADTPFEMDGLAKTTNLLMEYGLSAQDAIDSMKMLGDISQGDANKLDSIALAYGQMSSAGKVQLQDVKQMINAGFNPLQQISEQTGESMTSLYSRISKGTLSVNEITAAMEKATSKGGKYYGAMKAQSKTLSGMLSTLKEDMNQLGVSLLSPALTWATGTLFPALINGVNRLKGAVSSILGKKETAAQIKDSSKALNEQARAVARQAANTSKAATATSKATNARKKATQAVKAAQKANKKFLASFDEIHNIDKQDSKGSGKSGAKKTTATPAVGGEVSRIGKALKGFTDTSKKQMPAIWRPFYAAWGKWGRPAIEAAKRAAKALKGLIDAIGKSWREVWLNGTGQKTIELILRIATDIFNIIADIAEGLRKAWEYNNTGTKIIQHLWNIFNSLLAVVEKVLWAIEQIVKRIDWRPLLMGLESILGVLDKIVADLSGGIIKFLDLLVKGDFRGAGKVISDTINKIFTDITDWIDKIDFSQIGKKLSDAVIWAINSLGELISGINWDDVVSGFLKLAGSILNAIVEFLSGVDWVGVLEAVITAIGKAIQSLMKTHSGRMALLLLTVFKGPAIKKSMMNAGLKMGLSLLGGIGKTIPKIVGLYNDSLIPNIIGAVGKIGGFVSGALSTGLPVLFGLLKTAAGTITAIIGSIPVVGWIAIATAAIAALFAYLYKHNKRFRETVNAAIKWLGKLPGKIGKWLANAGKTISSWVEGVVRKVTALPGRLAQIAANIKRAVLGKIRGIFTWITGKIDAVKKAISGVKDAFDKSPVGKALNSTPGKVATAGIAAVSGNPLALGASFLQNIPHLANGGVLGRNEPRLAVVGDNRHSGEIVTPIDTLQKMLDAAMTARGGNGYDEAVIDLLQRLIETVDKKNLTIDGDSLENGLNARRERRYIRTGKAAK